MPNMQQISIVNTNRTNVKIYVEIADTLTKKARGLMFRQSLGKNEGMLFIFDKPCTPSFWMLFVSFPLEAIFFSEDGTVVDIIQMKPGLVPFSYTPKANAKYVLEVNHGFAKKNNIQLQTSTLEI